MKIVAISDTHGLHHQIKIPEGDLLIHTGDVSDRGEPAEIEDFLEWFSSQPHQYKVFIAGNHDFYFEKYSPEVITAKIPNNITYLYESGCTIEGIKIWGSPFSPIPYRRWAFNRERGADIQPHWDKIPENLDILLVHGPAYGILDKTTRDQHVGCENLKETLKIKQPKLFIFGHIHEARGEAFFEDIHCINASSVDRYRKQLFEPFVFEF
ncbi:MAG: metallophosphatase domain-containing protein [Saprospiraceae bacterium]|nr:metallophosphatase domain-containing protein [Saprospiraceae bacterium]